MRTGNLVGPVNERLTLLKRAPYAAGSSHQTKGRSAAEHPKERELMIRMLLAAAAAFALTTAAPAYACPDCKDCPKHKVAAAEQAEKKDAKDSKDSKVAGCPCGKGAECKCGEKCDCPHCHGAKAAPKKEEPKKT
jgi:hypothetical protein